MINPIPVLIEWITSIITCEPGDCISTGTPAGCGTFMQPPKFLEPGDEVVCLEETIGELRNRVVAGE
jgi:2-keto-4-pentenoate hydratase/2-oxohepta-3-ene-1,7-dioic acid hydratase in catechol pathway